MKEHRIILLLFIQLVALRVTAQWSVGLSGGYAFNYYNYDSQYMYGLDFKGHHGIAVDLPVSYQFNEHWGVVSGLSAQQKGYWLKGATSAGVYYPFVYRNDWYLALPIMAECKFDNTNIKPIIDVGGYMAGWLASIVYLQGLTPNGELSFHYGFREFNNRVDERLEYGIVTGTGVEWKTKSSQIWFVHIRCYFALSNQQKDYQTKYFPSRNTTLLFQIGKKFNLKQSKQ